MKNAIIIGVAIVVASIILALSFPRYQLMRTVSTEPADKDGFYAETTIECVFDMVTGKRFTRTTLSTRSVDTKTAMQLGPLVRFRVRSDEEKSVAAIIKKQIEVFGKREFTGKEWLDWQAAHHW